MSGTAAVPGPQAPSVFVQLYDSLVSSGCLATLSGNALKVLTALGLAATPLGRGSRKNQAFFQDLVAAGVVSSRDDGRLFVCLRHRELVRRTGLSKNTLSRCTAELQEGGMVEKRRVHQVGGTAYNLFFLLPGAHLDKYNTLYPRRTPSRPAAPSSAPDPQVASTADSVAASTGPEPAPQRSSADPETSQAPRLETAAPEASGSESPALETTGPSPDGRQTASPQPVPTVGRPAPAGSLPSSRTLPTVGTNSRSFPTTTPPTTCDATPTSGLEQPVLVHARALYASEIGLVTPLVDGELRRLSEQHPDPLAWDTAFREAVRANVRQLRYVRRVLDARARRTSRNNLPLGGNHDRRNQRARSPVPPPRSRSARRDITDEEVAEAQRRASAVEPLDLLVTLGTANA
jgi:hypothetical protein